MEGNKKPNGTFHLIERGRTPCPEGLPVCSGDQQAFPGFKGAASRSSSKTWSSETMATWESSARLRRLRQAASSVVLGLCHAPTGDLRVYMAFLTWSRVLGSDNSRIGQLE